VGTILSDVSSNLSNKSQKKKKKKHHGGPWPRPWKATAMSPWPDLHTLHSHGDHGHGPPSMVVAMDLRARGEPRLVMAMEPWRSLASMTMTGHSPPWASIDVAFHGMEVPHGLLFFFLFSLLNQMTCQVMWSPP